ncbi:RDD family protein [Streptomyces sp. KR80]|uniref:RDD family protein n=1 Tax=Streptomyces sp. KR80 TaxID=3457426 RepID=UPI003FD649F2
MSYPPPPGDPNNPYAQPPQGQPYGYPQQQPGQPYGGYPQQQPGPAPAYPQQQPGQAYGYPQQQPGGQPYGAYPQQQPGYGGGYAQPGAMPGYAGWWSRFGASLLDGLIIGVPFSILAGIAGAVSGGGENVAAAVIVTILGWLVAIGLGIWMIYQEGKTGQTIGKRAVSIRLLRERDGQPLGFGMAFARRLLHIVDALPFFPLCLGYLWPAWDAKKQTFADKIVSSVVIKSQ